MLRYLSTTRRRTLMVVHATSNLMVHLLTVAALVYANSAAAAGERGAVVPTVHLGSAKREFSAREKVDFVFKNHARVPLYFYCGLEIQSNGRWRETVIDVTRPFGSKSALTRPVSGFGVAKAYFVPASVLGDGFSRVVPQSRVRLKCWYKWSRMDHDSEDRVIRSEPFQFRP